MDQNEISPDHQKEIFSTKNRLIDDLKTKNNALKRVGLEPTRVSGITVSFDVGRVS